MSRDASGSTLGRVGGGQLVEPEPPYDPHAMAKKLAAMMTVEELQTLLSVRKKTLTMSEAACDAFRGFTAEELFTLAEIKRKEASGEYTYGDDDPDDDA